MKTSEVDMYAEAKLNPHMITIARESRGYTHLELSEIIQISKSTAWRLEQDNPAATEETLSKLSNTLHYPVSFFFQQGEVLPMSLSYRRSDVVSAKLLSQIEANINIYRLNLEQLLSAMQWKETDLPVLDVSKYGSPQECAKQLRKLWKIEKGAINNVSEILEKNKILLIKSDFGTELVDGRFVMASKKFPVIVTNKSMLGDRQRFTLAYQIGMLVMHLHTSPAFNRDLSHEANLFAAELLMPAKDITGDLQELGLPKLAELKKKWKVSMQALVYRANDLEIISDNNKRYLLQQFNQQNIRRREPPELDIPTEQYKLVRDLMTQYRTKQKLSVAKMADFLHLEQEDFLQRYND
ncbi:MAG: helix-turn-helix domain-containing protein [Bacteroidia bacterium]